MFTEGQIYVSRANGSTDDLVHFLALLLRCKDVQRGKTYYYSTGDISWVSKMGLIVGHLHAVQSTAIVQALLQNSDAHGTLKKKSCVRSFIWSFIGLCTLWLHDLQSSFPTTFQLKLFKLLDSLLESYSNGVIWICSGLGHL